MGSGSSRVSTKNVATNSRMKTIRDRYESMEEVKAALREAGLEASEVILGIDFTKSNAWNGTRTFDKRSLHSIGPEMNPYQVVMSALTHLLRGFDDDQRIPCYGFGDGTTGGSKVFSFFEGDCPALGLEGVLERYKQIASCVTLSGPTSFAPLIHKAIEVVAKNGFKYHILVIIADGQVSQNHVDDTIEAIVRASNLPLSIIMVGVGDGPWEIMEDFDDQLPKRSFDNFQFVDFHTVWQQASVYSSMEEKLSHLGVHVLMEIPEQFKAVMKLKLLENSECRKYLGKSRPITLPPPPEVTLVDQFTLNNAPSAPVMQL